MLSNPLHGTKIDIDTYCIYLSQAASLQPFNAAIRRLVGVMEFTDFHFSPSTRKEKNLLLPLTSIQALMARHIEEKQYVNDRLLQHGSRAREPIYLSAYKEAAAVLPDCSEMAATRKTISLFEKHQFWNALTIPVLSCHSRENMTLTVMCKGMPAETFIQLAEGHKINLMRLADAIYVIAHLKFPELFLPEKTLKQPRAKKPFQALSWASQGYSHKQVAVKMHISTKTVNDHLRAAREYLNAKSTCHAVRVALINGMIC